MHSHSLIMRRLLYLLYHFSLFFLMLCRLRNSFHLKDLQFLSKSKYKQLSVLFNSYFKYMFITHEYLSLWPLQKHTYWYYTSCLQENVIQNIYPPQHWSLLLQLIQEDQPCLYLSYFQVLYLIMIYVNRVASC